MAEGHFQVGFEFLRRNQSFRLQIQHLLLEDAQPAKVTLGQQQL